MCDTVTGDTVECHTETADNGVTLRQPYQWLITKTKLVSPHQPQVTVTTVGPGFWDPAARIMTSMHDAANETC